MSSKESVVKREQQKRPARKASKRSLQKRFSIVKTCMMCGKKFATDNERDMFCSFECREKKNAEYVKAVKIQFQRINGRMPLFCEAEIRKAIVVLRAYLAKKNLTAEELLVGMGEIKACLDRAADFNKMLAIV